MLTFSSSVFPECNGFAHPIPQRGLEPVLVALNQICRNVTWRPSILVIICFHFRLAWLAQSLQWVPIGVEGKDDLRNIASYVRFFGSRVTHSAPRRVECVTWQAKERLLGGYTTCVVVTWRFHNVIPTVKSSNGGSILPRYRQLLQCLFIVA